MSCRCIDCFDRSSGICCRKVQCPECIQRTCCFARPMSKQSVRDRSLWLPIFLDAVSDAFHSNVLAFLGIVRLALGHVFPSLLFFFDEDAYRIEVCSSELTSLFIPGCHFIELGVYRIASAELFSIAQLAGNMTWNFGWWIFIAFATSVTSAGAILDSITTLYHMPIASAGFTYPFLAVLLMVDTVMAIFSLWVFLEEAFGLPRRFRQSGWDTTQQMLTDFSSYVRSSYLDCMFRYDLFMHGSSFVHKRQRSAYTEFSRSDDATTSHLVKTYKVSLLMETDQIVFVRGNPRHSSALGLEDWQDDEDGESDPAIWKSQINEERKLRTLSVGSTLRKPDQRVSIISHSQASANRRSSTSFSSHAFYPTHASSELPSSTRFPHLMAPARLDSDSSETDPSSDFFTFPDNQTFQAAKHYHVLLQQHLLDGAYFDNDALWTTRYFSFRIMVAVVFGICSSISVMIVFDGYIKSRITDWARDFSLFAAALVTAGFIPAKNIFDSRATYRDSLADFISASNVASPLAIALATVFSLIGQARLLRSFRRDVLRSIYWISRREHPELIQSEDLHASPILNPLHGKTLNLAAAPLMFGYAAMNANFFGLLVFFSYFITHMVIGVKFVRETIFDLFFPNWPFLFGELTLVALRYAFFWFVHLVSDYSVRITQYRWFCFFDLCFYMIGYDIGLFMIGARIVFSILYQVFSIFRIDKPQFPGIFAAFDPLHNAYIATVVLEAQLQLEHIAQKYKSFHLSDAH